MLTHTHRCSCVYVLTSGPSVLTMSRFSQLIHLLGGGGGWRGDEDNERGATRKEWGKKKMLRFKVKSSFNVLSTVCFYPKFQLVKPVLTDRWLNPAQFSLTHTHFVLTSRRAGRIHEFKCSEIKNNCFRNRLSQSKVWVIWQNLTSAAFDHITWSSSAGCFSCWGLWRLTGLLTHVGLFRLRIWKQLLREGEKKKMYLCETHADITTHTHFRLSHWQSVLSVCVHKRCSRSVSYWCEKTVPVVLWPGSRRTNCCLLMSEFRETTNQSELWWI